MDVITTTTSTISV